MIKYSTWKIVTINVKGINNTSKFDDLMEWIMNNNIDITIVIETKINQVNASFKIKKYQKNYDSFWDLDKDAPKSSGVSVILRKDTVRKYIYAQHLHLERFINIRLKFKGKKDISILAIYGNADSSDKATKEKITKLIKQHIYTNSTSWPAISMKTPIITPTHR